MPNILAPTTIAAICMLAGCASAPQQGPLRVEAVQQVRHSVNEVAAAYYQLGRHHQQRGDLELALTAYNYAVARDPRDPEARSAAAAIHAQQGRLAQAHALLLAVSAEYPRMAQAHNNLGYINHLKGDYAAAAASYRAALALAPHNNYARNNLALALDAAQRSADASVRVAEQPAAASAAVASAVPPPTASAAGGGMALVALGPNHYQLTLPQASSPAPVPAVAPPPAADSVRTAQVEVANGDGAPGLARRVGALLGKQGVRVARLSNHKPFGQQLTQVQYRRGYAAQAEALGKLLEGPVQLSESAALRAGADVKLVLGRDTRRLLALRDAGAGAAVLAAR